MQKLFVENISDEKIILDGESARHIAKSLRMRVGDVICVTDGGGEDYGCQIEEITKDEVVLKVCYKQVCESEPSCKVTIYQGVPKSTKLEDIIQKCVELGVTEIVPTLTKRCVSRPDDKSAGKKNQRYQKIALEAAQQSGRGIVPKIENMKNLKQALAEDESEVKIVFFEGGGKKLTDIIDKNTKSVSIFIGPEGGFEEAEVEQIEAAGGVRATLGKRILRTQTAPVAGLTAIMLLTGNLE
ncbi:16S rRNA (uracil(1498)-N(3))-methyltransferase [Eubacterium coprostanoligenes]|uniref:Ribosomal RNA small subunit methyltransferase E n=1 Tax=Eubacterium coprostanoligenes TaxID=290054 RepID=A0A1T4M5F9_9FIRM|nr:16S rRNA (uracil(1498)-N(3))-methyltransferase [Eubacterium coprostanoligenes]SJZ62213.1 16S rRNA (uracil1498-N3)-methyltransferase [Eubacterium coprostanoligenes]